MYEYRQKNNFKNWEIRSFLTFCKTDGKSQRVSSPCFTPLRIFTLLEFPRSVLIVAVVCSFLKKGILFMHVPSRNFHKLGSTKMSNMFTLSIKKIRDRFHRIHFS